MDDIFWSYIIEQNCLSSEAMSLFRQTKDLWVTATGTGQKFGMQIVKIGVLCAILDFPKFPFKASKIQDRKVCIVYAISCMHRNLQEHVQFSI